MGTAPSRHVVLLGDSTFDNGRWVDGPSVSEHMRDMLVNKERVTLCARDGALVAAVAGQMEAAPADATHFVVSVGGNDATGAATTVLTPPVANAGEAYDRMHHFVQEWEAAYAAAVEVWVALARGRPVVLCSCYDPCFGAFNVTTVSQGQANMMMALLADVVLRVASRHRLPVVDLRRVSTQVADFANPIEPSVAGGRKIAAAVLDALATHPVSCRNTVVYPHSYPQSTVAKGGVTPGTTQQTSVLDDPSTAAVAAALRSGE
eukprot:TRINITY_DN8971_c0_g1_i2.p1 TRINITY_DN8971_c0_g1~~TRINITY_DN8971_c0_g1_i2.p1  ORF type:complete len:262 (+),score=69.02 TRINITY_DN8971_c0_g1_i2:40-825(+)